jgi:hypothetical protein
VLALIIRTDSQATPPGKNALSSKRRKHIFLMKISADDQAANGVLQIGQTSAFIQV